MLRYIRQSLGRKLLVAISLPSFAIAIAGAIWLVGATEAPSHGVNRSVVAAIVAIAAALLGAQLLGIRLFVEWPLRRLAEAIRKSHEGDFLHRIPVERTDELGQLAEAFNSTLAAITDLNARRLDDAQSIASMQRELDLKAQVEAQHRLLDETNRRLQGRLKELTLLFDLARTLNSTLQLDELLHFVSELLGRSLGYNQFLLLLVDETSGDLVVKATFGLDPGLENSLVARGQGAAGWASQHRQVLLVRDARNSPHRLYDPRLHGMEGSFLAVPMLHKDQCVGVLDLFRPVVDAFTEDEVRLLQSVASLAAMAIANARLHQEMVKLSNTDALTGIHNRRSFFSRLEMELEHSERFEHPVALAMIDVDHFKELNDTWGHLAGDGALKRVAQLIASRARKVDTVARYGGEEFALVLPGARSEDASATAEKLQRLVETTAIGDDPDGPRARVTISIGVASYPQDARDLATLVDCADAALYAAKRSGRNVVRRYEPGMRDAPGRRRDVRVTAQVEPDGSDGSG
jgi:diguanylate cyclase (GGDEF)-like protein